MKHPNRTKRKRSKPETAAAHLSKREIDHLQRGKRRVLVKGSIDVVPLALLVVLVLHLAQSTLRHDLVAQGVMLLGCAVGVAVSATLRGQAAVRAWLRLHRTLHGKT